MTITPRPAFRRAALTVAFAAAMPLGAAAKTPINPVEPPPLEGVTPENSRFGINLANTNFLEDNKQLGLGWVRFENAKWPFASPAPNTYAFTGSVAPWNVNMDQIIGDYHDAGMGVLPMMFQTPAWAAAPIEGDHGRNEPPRDPAEFGQYCFQFAARYGQREVPSSRLLTEDKDTGKGYVEYFEIWNEPNLNPRHGDQIPSWGPWRQTMTEFWPVFRAGAEGVKAAYPDAKVTSPGFAGMTPETVDCLRTHTYPDGKRPIDFVDVINVHFYSGQMPPETAGKDPNTNADLGGVRYEEHLRRLAEWRDEHRPGAAIWLTETGHDTGGPIGISEELQAARIPRNLMIAIQSGVDKIFIYREKGSTPTKHAAAGLLRNDGSKKPSWYTVATLTRQLHGADPICRLPIDNDNVRAYAWERNGQTLVTAWTIEGEEKLGVELGGAEATDAFGHVTSLDSTAGLVIDDFPRYLSELSDPDALKPLMAEAKRLADEREAALAQLASRQAYLFDFGAGQEPVSVHLGKMRVYEKVPHTLQYDKQRGYGFEGKAREDGFQHWYKPVAEKYMVAAPGDVAFRFDAKPGTYEVTFLAEVSRGKERTLTITGGEQPIDVELAQKAREPQSVTLRTEGGPIRLSANGEYAIRWLQAVRTGD